jgi:Fic family protein
MTSHLGDPGPAAPTAVDIERFIDLLDRVDVRQAILFAAASALPLDSLEDLPVPAGFTRAQTIGLVSAINRTGAVYSPIPDVEGRLHWYVYTALMRQALGDIDRYCTEDSRLFEETRTRGGTRFLIQSNLDEAICAAMLDGVQIDYDSAKDLLLMHRQPRTTAERLVLNQFQLGEQLSELTDQPWTPQTMYGLYARLTAGVPARSARTTVADAPQRDAVMRGMCEYAASTARWRCEHPAITASILRAVIVYWEPFPMWNGMMSRIVFRLHALKKGYPVLGHLPISRSEFDLARHPAGVFPGQPVDAQTQVLDRYHEANATSWLTVQLILMTHALEQLRSRIQRAEVIDKAVRNQLQADTSLNHRQRSIIGRALRVPGATFRIGYHRTTHGIGYATAHRDLAALVEQGYLVQETQGRAIVFTAAPDLEERLGSLEDVGRIEDFEVDLPPELLTRAATPGAAREQ